MIDTTHTELSLNKHWLGLQKKVDAWLVNALRNASPPLVGEITKEKVDAMGFHIAQQYDNDCHTIWLMQGKKTVDMVKVDSRIKFYVTPL